MLHWQTGRACTALFSHAMLSNVIQINIKIFALYGQYTANSIKVVFPKANTMNYERAGDDGLLFI